MSHTAEIASPLDGDKPYHELARAALPLLVRQAAAGQLIYYSTLAAELGMRNPRNLGLVLGSVGKSLIQLSEAWKVEIPPIQCLVVNKATGLPGEGIGWFLINKNDFGKLPLRRRREIVQAELQHIYAYPHWDDVLNELGLVPVKTDFSEKIADAAGHMGGGEGEEHKRLKNYIANHPHLVGLRKTTTPGATEYPLPSGDSLDVSFNSKKKWVAVEVKSRLSDHADIVRGIFQCVKYLAVMEAVLLSKSQLKDARAVLVLQARLPDDLRPLCNLLGVEVIESIEP